MRFYGIHYIIAESFDRIVYAMFATIIMNHRVDSHIFGIQINYRLERFVIIHLLDACQKIICGFCLMEYHPLVNQIVRVLHALVSESLLQEKSICRHIFPKMYHGSPIVSQSEEFFDKIAILNSHYIFQKGDYLRSGSDQHNYPSERFGDISRTLIVEIYHPNESLVL